MSTLIDPNLLDYAITSRQKEIIRVRIAHDSNESASKALGITRQSVSETLKLVKKQASDRLYAPDNGLTYPVQEGYTGDYTIQRDADGNIERSWIKGKPQKEQQQAIFKAFVEGLLKEILPAKPSKFKKNYPTKELASAIIFGDAHIGMLAHAIETMSEDCNLEQSTADIRAAIDYCVDCAVPSEEGWFVNVGDWTHIDTSHNTTTNGTKQDVSATHNQIMKAAGLIQRYCIDKMLTKFKVVRTINARGNHDNDTAFALNMYLGAVYEKEPRVEVLGNDAKFNFLEFGKCLIGVNHGNQINISRLCGVMTRVAAEAWGRTTFRRIWVGHIHHKTMQEHDSGITVESFHTLAAPEIWHADSGYGAERRVTMITLHREYGEVNRMSPSLELIRATTRN